MNNKSQTTNHKSQEYNDKYAYVKRDLIKSAVLSLLAIVVIVVVYWFEVRN